MGGDGNASGGKGGSWGAILNPTSMLGDAMGMKEGKSTFFDPFGIGSIDPMGDMNMQAFNNTSNWMSGKESFGSHSNWFGRNKFGSTMNDVIGADKGEARKSAQEWDAYERKNLASWEEWSQNTGQANPHADRMTSENNSLLLDDEEL